MDPRLHKQAVYQHVGPTRGQSKLTPITCNHNPQTQMLGCVNDKRTQVNQVLSIDARQEENKRTRRTNGCMWLCVMHRALGTAPIHPSAAARRQAPQGGPSPQKSAPAMRGREKRRRRPKHTHGHNRKSLHWKCRTCTCVYMYVSVYIHTFIHAHTYAPRHITIYP